MLKGLSIFVLSVCCFPAVTKKETQDKERVSSLPTHVFQHPHRNLSLSEPKPEAILPPVCVIAICWRAVCCTFL